MDILKLDSEKFRRYREKSFEVIEKLEIRDIQAIIALPLILLVVNLLPGSFKDFLSLNYAHTRFWAFYTTVYVHGSWSHLLNNIGSFLLYVPLFYILCALSNHKRFFRRFFLFSITLLPISLSIFNLYYLGRFDLPGSVGFSGVISFYMGLLPIAFFLFLEDNVSSNFDVRYSIAVFLSSLSLTPYILTGFNIQNLTIFVVVNLVSGGYLYQQYREFGKLSVNEIKERFMKFCEQYVYFEIVALALIFIMFTPFMIMVSADSLVQNNTFKNIPIHFTGYSIGFLLPYILNMGDRL